MWVFFPSVASSHKRVLLIPGVPSAYLWDEIKTLCELYQIRPAKCFYQHCKAPLGFALKRWLVI